MICDVIIHVVIVQSFTVFKLQNTLSGAWYKCIITRFHYQVHIRLKFQPKYHYKIITSKQYFLRIHYEYFLLIPYGFISRFSAKIKNSYFKIFYAFYYNMRNNYFFCYMKPFLSHTDKTTSYLKNI